MPDLSDRNASALDRALEAAITNRDFVAVRNALVEWGYPIPKDESEPDLLAALVNSLEINGNEAVDLGSAGRMFHIEEMVRNREADRLQLLLFMLGHKIDKPDYIKRLAEQEGPSDCAEECPVCFPH